MLENRTFHAILPILIAALSAAVTNSKAKAAVNIGSSSWVWQNPLPQGDTLNAISCPSASTCFAVRDLGTIFVTTNGGTDWAGQLSPTNETLRGISYQSFSGAAFRDHCCTTIRLPLFRAHRRDRSCRGRPSQQTGKTR